MAQWKIERRQGACTACEREFADGERHASQLYTGEDGALARKDLCDACWRKVQAAQAAEKAEQAKVAEESDAEPDDGPYEGLFYWYTRHQVHQRQTVQLDLASLERLFVELEGREELKVRELRYVLCLLLMRKRRVKLERVIRDGANESFRVKRPRVDERYLVHVFDFDAERVAEIRAELQAIFDGADGEEGISLAHLSDEAAADPESADGEPSAEDGDQAEDIDSSDDSDNPDATGQAPGPDPEAPDTEREAAGEPGGAEVQPSEGPEGARSEEATTA